jgi:hypothetical protein
MTRASSAITLWSTEPEGKTEMGWYRRAAERSVSRAGISPSLILIAMLALLVLMGWRYQAAVERSALATVIVLAAAGLGWFVVMFTRAYWQHRSEEFRALAIPPVHVAPGVKSAIEMQIDAERLADDTVTLTAGPDGEIIEDDSLKD